jgi:Ca2+-binding RTX toxin-like protein
MKVDISHRNDVPPVTRQQIEGTEGPDTLIGTNDPDQIYGFGGNDQLSGVGGDDLLDGGSGTDTMDGGLGNDTFVVDSAGDIVLEALSEGDDRVIALVSYTLPAAAHIETLHTASAGALTPLTLRGNDFGQSIYGNAGDNLLSGRGGNDYLVALEGNDILIGVTGNDTLSGGTGNDQYQVDSSGDDVIEAVGEGDDLVTSSVNFTLDPGVAVETLAAAEGVAAIALTGNELGQSIYGNAGNNSLTGGGGADYLVGQQGDDTYYLTDGREKIAEVDFGGHDILYSAVDYALNAGAQVEVISAFPQTGTAGIDLTGNEFANHMVGNDGANVLSGGAGTDVLSGRDGADIFLFDFLGENNADRVLDFILRTDKIGLEDSVFTGLTPGALSSDAFRTGTFAQDSTDRIIHDPVSGNLWFDADGSGPTAMVHFGIVTAGIPLSAGDFVVM